MSLTPLHRTAQGGLCYTTDCGRFIVYRAERSSWHVTSYETAKGWDWSDWLATAGLLDTEFFTRKDAIDSLVWALTADSLLTAATPA